MIKKKKTTQGKSYRPTVQLNGLTFETSGASVLVWNGDQFVDSFETSGVLIRNAADLYTEAINYQGEDQK